MVATEQWLTLTCMTSALNCCCPAAPLSVPGRILASNLPPN